MKKRGVKYTTTTNPDGTVNLQLDPADILAEAERQLSIEKSFPFFMRDKEVIKRQEEFIADWKKKHGL